MPPYVILMRMTTFDSIDRFILMDEMKQITRYSEDQILRLERERVIPARRYIGKRKTGWLLSEVREWIQNRPTVR